MQTLKFCISWPNIATSPYDWKIFKRDAIKNAQTVMYGELYPEKLCIFFWTLIDTNECANAGSHNCSSLTSECLNTDGGYSCQCKAGYVQKNAYECEGLSSFLQSPSLYKFWSKYFSCIAIVAYTLFFKDFDECKTNIDGCTQICINVNGSYDCDCYFGFSLDDDRKTCSKG